MAGPSWLARRGFRKGSAMTDWDISQIENYTYGRVEARLRRPRGRPQSIDHQRLKIIADAIEQGDGYQKIADHLGVSRERIRQLVKAHGLPLAETSWPKVRLRKAAYIQAKAARLESRERFISELVEKVRTGASIASACPNRTTEALIAAECRKRGIVSRHGRWHDFSKRIEIIKEGLQLRQTWSQIADVVSIAEGRSLKGQSARAFAAARGLIPRDYTSVKASYPRKPKKERPPKVSLGPYLGSNDRAVIVERAYELKPVASASQIGAHLGLTRNAVIGIWHRHAKRVSSVEAPQ